MKIKKTTIWLGGLFLSLSMLTGCGGSNAHDGKTGLIASGGSNTDTGSALQSIQKNILIADSNDLVTKLSSMEQLLNSYEQNLTQTDVGKLQNSFKDILKAWKAVHTLYIAGKYDNLLLDTPRFIEFFVKASKRQDIPAEVQDALNSSSTIENALFKNTSKSMQALEFLIFDIQKNASDIVALMNKDERRRIAALKIVNANLKKHASVIADFYLSQTDFVSDTTKALNSLVNQLRQSAFDLREKRIGEPAGLVAKTKDNPDPSTLAYYNSKSSLFAAKAILEAHRNMMGTSSSGNFGTFAATNGASQIVTNIRASIDASLSIIAELDLLEEAITTTGVDPKVEILYAEIQKLENIYTQSLIESLNLTATLIDADGD